MKFCINNPASNYKMKIAAETQNRLRYMYLKKEKKTLVFLEQRKYWNLWTKISLLLFQMKSYVWESIGYSSHVFTSFDFPKSWIPKAFLVCPKVNLCCYFLYQNIHCIRPIQKLVFIIDEKVIGPKLTIFSFRIYTIDR